ncbi:MAG TPA: anti-sigma factor [Devosia sp.]|nr:anti-sigma factor [Devosia sp.]
MSQDGHMPAVSEDDRVLVAEYVLGLLPPAEHPRMAARLAAEPALRAEQRLWTLRLASLDREFVEASAPAAVMPRIEARLFGTSARTSFWDSLALWRGIAAGAVAVAVIAIGFNVLNPRPDPRQFAEQLVAALQDQGSGVSFVAVYDSATGSVRLTALTGAPVPEKDYELWAIQGGQTISMGVVPVDRKVDVKLPVTVAPGFGAGTVLAVTLEQKGGSPTGVAQGPIVAVGTATLI